MEGILMVEVCVWSKGSILPDGSRVRLKYCRVNRCKGVFKAIPPKYENCFCGKDEIKDERGIAVKDRQGRIL